MAEIAPILFGAFLLLGGTLSAINHPIIDSINRGLKSMGTTQRASDIQMSQTSVLIGRLLGSAVALVGLLILFDGIS